jgi:hypothetical protein
MMRRVRNLHRDAVIEADFENELKRGGQRLICTQLHLLK